MLRSTLLEIADTHRADKIGPEESAHVHAYFADQIANSQHGQRFNTRPYQEVFDDGMANPFDVAQPYIVAREGTPDFQRQVAQTALSLVMPKEDGEALVKAMGHVYYSDRVQSHLKERGSIAWTGIHFSYADKIAEIAALTLARLDEDEPCPNETQDVFISRLVGLFEHPLIKMLYDNFEQDHQGGVVLEDVILPLAGAIQTFPATPGGRTAFNAARSGNKLIRNASNTAVLDAFAALMDLGGRSFHISATGSEAKMNPDNGRLREQKVGSGTIDMLSGNYGKDREGEKNSLLVIPTMILPDPFRHATKEMPINPQRTPFAILAPRTVAGAIQTHAMMLEIVEAANILKPSGVPLIEYDPLGPNKAYRPHLPPRFVEIHHV